MLAAPRTPHRGWVAPRGHRPDPSARVVATMIGAMVLLSSGVAVARTSHDSHKAAIKTKNVSNVQAVLPHTGPRTPQVEMLSTEPPRERARRFANGSYTDSCSYVLANLSGPTAQGPWLIAQANLRSTSTKAVKVHVTARWTQVIRPAITQTRTVTLPRNGTKTVHFSVPVSQDSMELFAGSPVSNVCGVRVSATH